MTVKIIPAASKPITLNLTLEERQEAKVLLKPRFTREL